MELPGTTYLLALGAISTTFVGFSAIIMVFRQTVGGGLSPLDSWITLVFVQLGFLVTAGSLTPPLLNLRGVPSSLNWRLCSGIIGLILMAFAVTYPRRRRAISKVRTSYFVWIDATLLVVFAAILLANAVGRPWAPNPGSFALGITGMMFTAGVGYLHALGNLHKEAKRAAHASESPATRPLASAPSPERR